MYLSGKFNMQFKTYVHTSLAKIKQSLSSNAGDERDLGVLGTVVGGHRAERAEGGKTHDKATAALDKW